MRTTRIANYGASSTVMTQVTSNRESISHFRINFHHLGLHSNATILDASLNLTRSTTSGSPTLALHQMDTVDVWIEDQVTWRRPTSSQLWDDGGREELGYASDSGVMGSQTSDDFAFDLTSVLQQHLDNRKHRFNRFCTHSTFPKRCVCCQQRH